MKHFTGIVTSSFHHRASYTIGTVPTVYRGGCDNCVKVPPICYKIPPCVATTASEKHKISWNQSKSVITLHQKSEMISLFDLLTQTKHKGVIISTLSAYYISLRPD